MRQIVRLVRQFTELGASAVQRRLDRGQAEFHHLADFLQGAAEHIHQDHAGALGDRKPHEGAQACAGNLAAQDDVGLIGNHVHLLARS